MLLITWLEAVFFWLLMLLFGELVNLLKCIVFVNFYGITKKVIHFLNYFFIEDIMNHIAIIKKKMKKAVVPVVAAGSAVLATASTSSAAIDFTSISTAIATATTDYLAGGAVLLAAFASIWGMKQVMNLFRRG